MSTGSVLNPHYTKPHNFALSLSTLPPFRYSPATIIECANTQSAVAISYEQR
jgi:hypothetical protein